MSEPVGAAFAPVIVESPFAAPDVSSVERNREYARAALVDCLGRGEAPFASHLLYTQAGVLRDGDPEQRARGIAAGFAWRRAAVRTVVYVDLGISSGMERGIAHSHRFGVPVVYRTIPGWVK